MTKETKELVEPSIVVFGYLLQEAILDGWRISEQWPSNFYGGQYIVSLERHTKADKKEEAPVEVVEDVVTEDVVEKDTGHGDPPKPEAPKRGPKPKQGK